MRFLLTFTLCAAATFAQVNINVGTLQVSQDAALSVRQFIITQTTRDAGRLQAGVDAVTTSITVTGTVPNVGDAIVIDSEAMLVSAVVGQVLTVTRGHLATTAALHGANSMVMVLKYSTFREWIRMTLIDSVSKIIDQYPAGSVATANGTISSAQTTIQTVKAGSVQ